jgi:pimeloyl-ACP methyl ester carboxylesterase
MRRAFPHAALEVLRGTGHLPMLEEPEALTRVLLDFAG